MKPGTRTGAAPFYCQECGDRLWTRVQAAQHVCPPCECPPGWQHQPDCHFVTGAKP